MFKTIFLGTTKFGKYKKVAPECPSWLRASTNLISLFYKLIYQDPRYANNNIATCPKYSSIKQTHRH